MSEIPSNPKGKEIPASQASASSLDPGFGTVGSIENQRLVNKDGSYNVLRKGQGLGLLLHPYQYMILIPWWKFLIVVVLSYFLINSGFAILYLLAGIEHLSGAPVGPDGQSAGFTASFFHAFFFSVQTITTVGYGSISPLSFGVNLIATVEAMAGLLGFALASGIMYGRFSKASARISFSENMLISPYRQTGGNGLMFRIVNQRKNQLIELSVRVVLICYKMKDGKVTRTFFPLKLERSEVAVLPLTWTIVHPIDEESPLWTRDMDYLREADAEFLINLKAYDDTFAQIVHVRTSYKVDELVSGAKFVPAYYHDEDGMLILEVDKVGEYKSIPLNLRKSQQTTSSKAPQQKGS